MDGNHGLACGPSGGFDLFEACSAYKHALQIDGVIVRTGHCESVCPRNGAVTVRWPEEDGGEEEAQKQQQQNAMAAFLGRASNKRQKLPDRHRMLHEAMLEPVTGW